MAALQRKSVDFIPVSPRIVFWLMEYYGHEYVRNNFFDAHLRAGKEFDFDPHLILEYFPQFIVDANPEDGWKYEEWLTGVSLLDFKRECHDDYDMVSRKISTPAGILTDQILVPHPEATQYGLSPNPRIIECLIKHREDVEKVMFLSVDTEKKRDDIKNKLNYEIQRIGEDGLLQVLIRSPLDHRAGDAYTTERMMMDYYEDRDLVKYILRRFQDEYTLRETRAFLEAGAKVIFGSWYYSSLSTGWSPQIFRELFVPLIKEHVELVHSYGAIYEYYDDGKVMPIIRDLKDCGIDAFTTLCPPPMGDVDIAQIKREIGDMVCLHGGVDLLHVIKEGTPQLIEQTVCKIVKAAGSRGLILGTSDSIRNGTPVENVKAFFAAGRKYGRV